MEARDNLPELSVSELSFALKKLVEEGFAYVRVKGEISGFKRHSSGHLYFTLKDADAVLDAVCWRGQAARLGLNPEDGMEVSCTGKLTTYPGRSKYQMMVDSINLAGQGALLKLLEERKRKLAALGLFEKTRKKKLPFLPQVIGVITSPTGAVIRDILHRLKDRFPCRVLLWPVAVQGEGAASQVASAIEGFNLLDGKGGVPRPDVIIVARGGGSIEDLWAFNEEIVVLAAANSKIPLISAVGHETDTTLIDYAADLRAPTPTAAAELATPVRGELIAQIKDDEARLLAASRRIFNEAGLKIQGLGRGITNPARLVEDKTQRLDLISEALLKAWPNRLKEWGNKLAELKPQEALKGEISKAALEFARKAAFLRPQLLSREIEKKEANLEALGGMLKAYSYQGVLERGFALVQDKSGVITSAGKIKSSGQDIEITFHDGKVAAKTKPKQESLF